MIGLHDLYLNYTISHLNRKEEKEKKEIFIYIKSLRLEVFKIFH